MDRRGFIASSGLRPDESYGPPVDGWQRRTPMTTPRHAVGATAIGDWIHVAGGGVQSAVHEAFALG